MSTEREQLERFFNTPRTADELKQMTRRILDTMQDKRTIERIWWSAIYFSMYGVVGDDGQAALADTGYELLGALLE